MRSVPLSVCHNSIVTSEAEMRLSPTSTVAAATLRTPEPIVVRPLRFGRAQQYLLSNTLLAVFGDTLPDKPISHQLSKRSYDVSTADSSQSGAAYLPYSMRGTICQPWSPERRTT